MKAKIEFLPTDSKITIFGHTFNGLDEIREAIEAHTRRGEMFFPGAILRVNPRKPVDGIHVLRVYEPYPCFDESDYEYEDRVQSDYFFSTKPFTRKSIMAISHLRAAHKIEFTEDGMPEEALPAIYYCGEGDIMTVATKEA